jgi:hypothetical protein
MVLLTSESRLLAAAVSKQHGLRIEERMPVLVRGLPAALHLIRRSAAVRR